jgi:hypothetical protein
MVDFIFYRHLKLEILLLVWEGLQKAQIKITGGTRKKIDEVNQSGRRSYILWQRMSMCLLIIL